MFDISQEDSSEKALISERGSIKMWKYNSSSIQQENVFAPGMLNVLSHSFLVCTFCLSLM